MKVKAICSPKVNMIIVLLIVSVCRPKVAYNARGLLTVGLNPNFVSLTATVYYFTYRFQFISSPH